MKLSTFEVVNDIRSGNIKTFEEVFVNYFPFLQKFAEGYVSNKDEASDIVQSVFLSVWEKRDILKEDTNLNNYLITLTKNKCLNVIKHLKARHTYLQNQSYNVNELLLNYYALENLNEDKLVLNELTKVIEDAINSLPGQCKEIFMMSRFDNMKYHEIADKMGISVKTVEKKMSISLEILRTILKDYLVILLFLHIR
jgi:RNA polymerase sigma-70 factor (ECF subfamily)